LRAQRRIKTFANSGIRVGGSPPTDITNIDVSVRLMHEFLERERHDKISLRKSGGCSPANNLGEKNGLKP
jgi:hypothetical protein